MNWKCNYFVLLEFQLFIGIFWLFLVWKSLSSMYIWICSVFQDNPDSNSTMRVWILLEHIVLIFLTVNTNENIWIITTVFAISWTMNIKCPSCLLVSLVTSYANTKNPIESSCWQTHHNCTIGLKQLVFPLEIFVCTFRLLNSFHGEEVSVCQRAKSLEVFRPLEISPIVLNF